MKIKYFTVLYATRFLVTKSEVTRHKELGHRLSPRFRHSSLKRKCEYLAGRELFRESYEYIGYGDNVFLDRYHDGRPKFTPGTVGSLSHCGNIVVSILSTNYHNSYGIDLESIIKTEQASLLQSRVGSIKEYEFLRDEFAISVSVTLLFSAKESAFKCLALEGGVGFQPHYFSLIGHNFASQQLLLKYENDQGIEFFIVFYQLNTRTVATLSTGYYPPNSGCLIELDRNAIFEPVPLLQIIDKSLIHRKPQNIEHFFE